MQRRPTIMPVQLKTQSLDFAMQKEFRNVDQQHMALATFVFPA